MFNAITWPSILFCQNITISALLSHQMEQLFKLEKELRQGKAEIFAMRTDVQQLENTIKQQEIRDQGHSTKAVVNSLFKRKKFLWISFHRFEDFSKNVLQGFVLCILDAL